MRNDKRIEELAEKWRRQEITEQERQEFDAWYNTHNDSFIEENTDETEIELKDRIYNKILERESIKSYKPNTLSWKRLSIAASILIALSAGGWMLVKQHHQQQQQQAMAHITSGGNKAILTLAGGKQIILTSAQNGTIAKQGNILINKTADGKVTYLVNDQIAATTDYNTISTPRGGQYWVTLADGTRVLLNASSSLRYPVAFSGKTREVELTGEAYFEVVHNAAQPFKVKAERQTIEDIGTHFNVNAYTDEPDARTTLLEGSVKVTGGAALQGSILKPGQQAILKGGLLTVIQANTEQAIAWKNGSFMFESESIASIMRKVARWYNVEVVFDGPEPADKFGGTVNRFENVSQLLNKLELTGRVHFKVEGRRIMVSQ